MHACMSNTGRGSGFSVHSTSSWMAHPFNPTSAFAEQLVTCFSLGACRATGRGCATGRDMGAVCCVVGGPGHPILDRPGYRHAFWPPLPVSPHAEGAFFPVLHISHLVMSLLLMPYLPAQMSFTVQPGHSLICVINCHGSWGARCCDTYWIAAQCDLCLCRCAWRRRSVDI